MADIGLVSGYGALRLYRLAKGPHVHLVPKIFQYTSNWHGRNKNWTMQRLLHRTLRFRYSPTGEQIQNGRTADEIPSDPITPWCGPPLFCPCFSCWKFRNFLLRNIALVYFSYLRYRYRLITWDIGLGLSSHPWQWYRPTFDRGHEMSALNIILQKNFVRKLSDEFSKTRVFHVLFAHGRVFQIPL